MFKLAELMKLNNHEGTRTLNLLFQRQTPYPLTRDTFGQELIRMRKASDILQVRKDCPSIL